MEKPVVLAPDIHSTIRNCRGVRVILDSDLAAIYGVPTFRFNEAVRRNIDKFPSDFLFQLTKEEVQSLISQSAISKMGRGGPYYFHQPNPISADLDFMPMISIECKILSVKELDFILDRKSTENLERGTPLKAEHLHIKLKPC